MSVAKCSLIVTNIVMFVLLLIILDAQGAGLLAPGAWEYKDLVAVLLSVVSIMVTFIGIMVAVAAIWGFQTLRTMAEQKAAETSKSWSDTYLSSDPFRVRADEAIKARIEANARDAVQDALAPVILRADAAPEII